MASSALPRLLFTAVAGVAMALVGRTVQRQGIARREARRAIRGAAVSSALATGDSLPSSLQSMPSSSMPTTAMASLLLPRDLGSAPFESRPTRDPAREAARAVARDRAAQVIAAEAARVQAARAANAALAATSSAAVAARTTLRARAPRVLVVDDSATIRRMTGRLLERAGYRVAYAVDGVDAIERVRAHAPDAVVTDIEMPRLDGLELARRLRADPCTQHLPILMVSSAEERYRDEAQRTGVDLLLAKPYPEEALLARLRQLRPARRLEPRAA